jgi:hypothetical protein
MSIGDSRCDNCQSKERAPWAGIIGRAPICLCRKCAGVVAAWMIKFIKDHDRLYPVMKRPRNKSKPITDGNGTIRCRQCEAQMQDWKTGESPYCATCQESPKL